MLFVLIYGILHLLRTIYYCSFHGQHFLRTILYASRTTKTHAIRHDGQFIMHADNESMHTDNKGTRTIDKYMRTMNACKRFQISDPQIGPKSVRMHLKLTFL